MDVIVVADDAATWLLKDLFGRVMAAIVQEEKGFLIVPVGEALKTMGTVNRGPHSTIDSALAEIETRTRGVCRRSAG